MDNLSLLKQLPLSIFRLNADDKKVRFVFVNEAFSRLLGKPEESLLKLRPEDVFCSPKHFQDLYQKALRSGTAVLEETECKVGRRIIPVRLTFFAARDEGGGSTVHGIVENKIPQKQAELEKAESKELFRTVFDNSAAAILVVDKQGHLFAWNPFAQKLLGWGESELFNRSLDELFVDGGWGKLRNQFLDKPGAISELDARIKQAGGKILDVSMSISQIRDAAGEGQGMILVLLDISRQKEVERRIRESENKIRIILDHSAAAITMTDAEERIISWNRYTEEMLGKGKEDLYLQHISVIYPEAEWQKIRQENIRRDGSRHHIETQVVRKDGRLIDVDLSVNVLKDANEQIVGSVGIIQDITEQKRVQQELVKAKTLAEEASSAKSLFLANMSHEVRTPMNTIIGMIDLTLDTQLTDEQRDNLSTVKNAADILLSLLNDILDLSRVEAGKIQLENIELSIPNIIKSVCKGLSVLAQKKGLQLIWEAAPEVPDVLIGDPVRIRQILVNLINNAIKFAFKGNIVTKVSAKEVTEEYYELLFSVRDEGIGIPKDKLDTIFEVFTQADASTTRRFGGTGLGLAISSKLVEMMGGRIWVESEEFKGSTFCFTARLRRSKRQDVSAVIAEEPSVGDGSAPLPGGRVIKALSILLAEDNIVNQKMAARMLEKRGWSVKTADNGKQVLEYLDQGLYDLILMDAQMPLLDGYETTRMIRVSEKQTGRHIPIVALTARAMSGDRQRCLDCGMDSYVTKPIDREKLYEAVEKFF